MQVTDGTCYFLNSQVLTKKKVFDKKKKMKTKSLGRKRQK